jgi:hypothetical protein
MAKYKLPRALCAIVGAAISDATARPNVSHARLDALFMSAGAPGLPAAGVAHHSKWKEWLIAAGQDPDVDGLAVLGNVLEEFMDLPPKDEGMRAVWENHRVAIENTLEQSGLRYYPGGRVLPNGNAPEPVAAPDVRGSPAPIKPTSIDDLLTRIVRGLPRAMYPLVHRRKGATELTFKSEYDSQDLLHALLRPWVEDIRPEEFTPSYAGSSSRMDFLLPKHSVVLELKRVRDRTHAKEIGKELTIDIAYYRAHPNCNHLWCVVYDPDKLIPNEACLGDLEGQTTSPLGSVQVKVQVIS